MVSRKAFIESLGGTCDNWNWSWSFVNHDKRWVIFGAWENEHTSQGDLIFTNDWESNNERKNPGFKQSKAHISLVEKDGYALFTFPMVRDERHPGTDRGTARIKKFTPEIQQRNLLRIAGNWFATESIHDQNDPVNEIDPTLTFQEGGKKDALGHRYERDPKARALCLAKHGFDCAVCNVNLCDVYGEIAKNFIHVHHLVPVSEMGGSHEVDPVNDLRPVCPNCHAIIHRRKPILSIEDARDLLSYKAKAKAQ